MHHHIQEMFSSFFKHYLSLSDARTYKSTSYYCGSSSPRADSCCQSSPNTTEFGILLKAVDLLSRWAKVGIRGAAGGLFIICISPRGGLWRRCSWNTAPWREEYNTFFVEESVFFSETFQRMLDTSTSSSLIATLPLLKCNGNHNNTHGSNVINCSLTTGHS